MTADLIQARGKTVLTVIHKLLNVVRNKEELPAQWNKSVILPIHKNDDKTVGNNYRGIITDISYITKSYRISISQGYVLT
jgi:hypothetical protein